MKNKVNEELLEYIEKEIFPLYNRNEEGHGIEHIKLVIERSLKFAEKYDVNIDMVYTISAYHDIGHYIDRKKHEIISAEIFMEDEYMKKYFNEEQRNIIKEAIEEHRASNRNEPRTIYGKIVSTADRTIMSIDDSIRRTYYYGKNNYSNLSEEEQYERVYDHLRRKYGENGYARFYLEDEEYEEALRKALSDKKSFIKRVEKVITQE